MKKKLLAVIIVSAMACGMLIGCGGSSSTTDTAAPAKTTDKAKENTDKSTETADKAKESSDTAKTDTSDTGNKPQVVQIPVTIINGTDVDFAELYTSSVNVEDWGSNLLGNGVTFGPGSGVQAAFNVDANNLKWDFKAVDNNGEYLEFNGLDLSNCNASGVKIKLLYNHDTQTGSITAE